jgi:16S rRNA (guanine966-N2)-methyltransferase
MPWEAMRITGGKAKSISLMCPKGDLVRPATDRMRESVFSSLGPSIVGSEFIDLFAGTGSYGLESLSRGAKKAYLLRKIGQLLEH